MKPVLQFNPSLYAKISNPQLSLNNSIVIRVETYQGVRKQVCCFDNTNWNLPREVISQALNQFRRELDNYYEV